MRAKYFNYRRLPRPARSSWRWFFGKLNELQGVLTLGVTLVLAGATVVLALATRDLVRGAEDTAKRQLRAYLYITANDFKLMDNPDGSSTVTITPSLKVFGLTPATSIIPGWYVAVQPVPGQIAFSGPTMIPESLLIQVHDVTNLVENPVQDLPLGGKSIQLKKEDVDALKQGHKMLNAFGTIRYDDVFGEARWTNFCWLMDWKDVMANNIELCPIYNNADWS